MCLIYSTDIFFVKIFFQLTNLITEYENSELKAKEHEIMTLDVNTMEEFENRHFEIVKNLCDDLAIATTFSEEKERLVENNLDYFLRHIRQIFEPNYIPTQEDILHVYIPTKRTIEYVLDKDKMKLGYVNIYSSLHYDFKNYSKEYS